MSKLLSLLLALILPLIVRTQPSVNFTSPDSICVGAPVNITNSTTGGTTFFWSFCSGNAAYTIPVGTNIGNPGNNMCGPVYITLVQDGAECFSFITNQDNGTHITRNFHGANFRNNPVSTSSLLSGGVLHIYTEAIQIKKDGLNWYGFVNNNSTILRLNFGTSLWNTPTTTDIGPFPNISIAHGLVITKEGMTWLGFFDSSNQNKLYRLNFGTSLTNIPTCEDLGNIAGFNHPCQIAMVKENGLYYLLATNFDNNSLSRINFGNSLFNTPTGQNLGNCGGLSSPLGITLLNDCETSTGYYSSYQLVPNAIIGRLNFNGGVSGTVSAQPLGNIGNLDRPHGFSELFRQNDSLFAYIVNRQTATLTRLSFPPVSNASIPTSSLYTPPSFYYTQPGTYNIRLVVNEGLANATTLCKTIVVGPVPTVTLGADRTICPGQTTILDAGPGYSSYLWSTGATSRTITVSTAGTFSVTVTKYGCSANDAVNVILSPCATASFTAPDSICVGAPVNITNTSTGGSSYYWNFCSGNAANIPLALNIGNPSSNMFHPVYITLVQDGADCFSFITNQGTPTHITRNYHGSNFRNNPISTVSLLQTGVIHTFCEGIQIKKENGNWYGFVNNNTSILRLEFGSSLWNNPTAVDIGPFPNIAVAHGLIITKEGNTWLGFFDSDSQNKLYRLNFGTSLTNNPVFQDLGNIAGFSHPTQIALVKENNQNYIMVMNYTNSSISRISFGTSLLNTPSGQNLGNCGGIQSPHGITLLNDCEKTTGYFTYYLAPPGAAIGRLDFTNGIGGTVTAVNLGNLGNLYYPVSFSEIFRQNDSLFTYVVNRDNNTLTRYSFPPSNNSTIGSSALFTPPSFSYTSPGTYHIRLVVNEGLPDESSICKTIVVGPVTTVSLGSDRTICTGQSTTLDPGGGYSSYLWSTGATSRTITVSTSGTYSVTVTKYGCQATDAVNVVVSPCASANFTLPDSACVGSPVNITNLTAGGTSYYWSFCSGNSTIEPTGTNIGNPGSLLNIPTYMTLVKDGTTCYSFVSSQGSGIIRYNHGSSFNNAPVSWTNLGTFGILGSNIEGIQVKNDNGIWYGFVCNNNTIVRLNFGSSLANTPAATDIGPFTGMNMAHGLAILKEGTNWVGFTACTVSNNLIRFNFGTSLSNIPVETNFGNFSGAFTGGPLCMVYENTEWWGLVNGSANCLIRVHFGNSLFNTPTCQNLGNPGGYNTVGGLTMIRDCDLTSGYFVNYLISGQLGKLTFTGGVGGPVTGTILGNIGSLNRPHSFSEIFREDDNLYSYITNRGTNTLTKLTFPPCSNSSVPSSTLFTPPSFSYNQPGTYNVRLIVNEGLFDESTLCKTIVIGPVPTVTLGNDRTICAGQTTTLDAGSGYSSYLWSTGATTRTISVSTAGTYSVVVTKSGCSATDAINVYVTALPEVNLGGNQSVCLGQTATFNAGSCSGCTYQWSSLPSGTIVGTNQYLTTGTAGFYKATVTNSAGCPGKDSAQLIVITPPILIATPPSSSICSGNYTLINLNSNNPDATFSWTASGSSPLVSGFSNGIGSFIQQQLTNINNIDETVTYTIIPSVEMCPGNPTPYYVTVSPSVTVDVTISASDNNVCEGTPVTFFATPINGGLTPFYQWKVNGGNSGTNSPSFSYIPTNNDQVRCFVASSMLACLANNPAPSNIINMSVTSKRIVDILITPSSNPVCAGIPVTFTSAVNYQGTSPVYQWFINGIPSGTNNDSLTFLPADNDLVSCTLTSSETYCITNNPAPSNNVILTVVPSPPVSVVITGDTVICEGTVVTFTATPVNGGKAPFYQWKLNGSDTGTNQATFTFTPLNSDSITCVVTSSDTCSTGNPATGPLKHITVNPNLPVSIVITESDDTLCDGTPVTFNAFPVNGGTLPFYQWKVNGIDGGSNLPTFVYTPSNADTVVCILTSSETCTINNQVSSLPHPITVNPNLPVDITISGSAGEVCAGTQVTYTATPFFGGSSPSYQWKVNDINAGTDQTGFVFTPANMDIVTCTLTSSESCTAANPVTSLPKQITVNPNLPVSISISASVNPVCEGLPVTFSSTPVNGGSPEFQWQINSVNAGSDPSLTYVPMANDAVTCSLTSDLPCITGSPAHSDTIIMATLGNPVVSITPCFDLVTSLNSKPIKLKGGIPLGGTYSGPGITNGFLYPSVAGPGLHTINYHYTNAALCTASSQLSVNILPASGFNCGDSLKDIRDNQLYPTIQIGSQCWMAENLRYGIMITDDIHQRDNCIPEKYCLNNSPLNCELPTGNFYQWDEVMQYTESSGPQGLCPPGWHIPAENEWNILFSNFVNNAFSGSNLKYTGFSGFNALPSGNNFHNMISVYGDYATFFWSSTSYGQYKAWAHAMNMVVPSVSLYPANRQDGFSVRCLHD